MGSEGHCPAGGCSSEKNQSVWHLYAMGVPFIAGVASPMASTIRMNSEMRYESVGIVKGIVPDKLTSWQYSERVWSGQIMARSPVASHLSVTVSPGSTSVGVTSKEMIEAPGGRLTDGIIVERDVGVAVDVGDCVGVDVCVTVGSDIGSDCIVRVGEGVNFDLMGAVDAAGVSSSRRTTLTVHAVNNK
jgi:hypothetical protein